MLSAKRIRKNAREVSKYLPHPRPPQACTLHARHSGCLPLRRLHPHAGRRRTRTCADVQHAGRVALRSSRSLRRRQPASHDDFRSRHHAVHYGVDYLPTALRCLPSFGRNPKGRRTGPSQDHAVDTLHDGCPRRVTSHWRGYHSDEDECGAASWRRLHRFDHTYPDHRNGLHHVAWRADHGPRHRQRNELAHLHRHRGRHAEWRQPVMGQSDKLKRQLGNLCATLGLAASQPE